MKKYLLPSTALSVLLSFSGQNASAQSQYFTTVSGGGTYSWDDPNWNASPASANTGPYTSSWVPGNFARFYNGAGDNYTVTVNAAESMSGMFLNAGTGVTLNLNDAGSGTGSLSVVANVAQASQNGFSWLTQGFLTGGGTLNINAPIGGSGGVEEESGGGNINLYGVNTFTGGFLATSSSTFIGFNNNASFGDVSSQIGFDGTTFAIMNNTGSSSVNIANAVQTIGNTGVNFIGNSVTMSGDWYLGGGSSAINIRNNGAAGATVTLTGSLSGTSGTITFSGANGAKTILSGANANTGNIAIGSAGDTAITVQLGAPNTIASSASVIMAGGTLSPGGFNHLMGSTTLGLTAKSTMDFTLGGTLAFANSSGVAWGAGDTLNLVDYTSDELRFGMDTTGLTGSQVADIDINGVGGEAAIDANGYIVVVPEPSTLAIGALGIGMVAFRVIKRRKA